MDTIICGGDAVCGVCKVRYVGPVADRLAERCCACRHPGCAVIRERGRPLCAVHDAQLRAEREAVLRWVEADDWDGPVELAGEYYPDLGELVAAHDHIGSDDVIHPCLVGRCTVPDIRGWIVERWWGEAGDGWEGTVEVSPAAAVLIAALADELRRCAPEVWRPDATRRVRFASPDAAESDRPLEV